MPHPDAPDAAPMNRAYTDTETQAALSAGTDALLELQRSLLDLSALVDAVSGNRRKRRAARKGKKHGR